MKQHIRWRRAAGIGFGVATHALFAVTVVFLYRFLEATECDHPVGSLLTDVVLALQFSLLHSAPLDSGQRGTVDVQVFCPTLDATVAPLSFFLVGSSSFL